jgi:hypothetical protein
MRIFLKFNDDMHSFRHLSEHGFITTVEAHVSDIRVRSKIYKGQRYVDKDRVKEFVDYQKLMIKERNFVHFPGTITACQIKGSTEIVVIDGQHRLNAMYELLDKRIYNDFPVILQIIRVQSEIDIHHEFININKSIPVPKSVLNPDKVVNSAIEILTKIYKSGFSTSSKMIRPKIPKDTFKDYLINNSVLEEKSITTETDLVWLIEQTNERIKDIGIRKLKERLGRRNKVERDRIQRWYKDCEDGKYMFLALFKEDRWGEWLDILLSIKPRIKLT